MDDAGQEEGHAPDIQIVDSDEVEFSLGKEVWDLPLEELPDISFGFEGWHGGCEVYGLFRYSCRTVSITDSD